MTCCGSEKTGFNPRHSQLTVSGKLTVSAQYHRLVTVPTRIPGGRGGVSLVTKDVTFIEDLVICKSNLNQT